MVYQWNIDLLLFARLCECLEIISWQGTYLRRNLVLLLLLLGKNLYTNEHVAIKLVSFYFYFWHIRPTKIKKS